MSLAALAFAVAATYSVCYEHNTIPTGEAYIVIEPPTKERICIYRRNPDSSRWEWLLSVFEFRLDEPLCRILPDGFVYARTDTDGTEQCSTEPTETLQVLDVHVRGADV